MAEPSNPLPPLRVCLLSGGASRRMGRDKALLPHPEGGCWLERTLTLLRALNLSITVLSRHPEHLELARRLREAWAEPGVKAAAGAGPEVEAGRDVEAEVDAERVAERELEVEAKVESEAAVGLELDVGMDIRMDVAAAPEAASPPLEALAEPPPWEGPLLALGRLARRYPRDRLLLCPVDMPWLSLEALLALRQAVDAEPERLQLAHDGSRPQPLLLALPLDPALRQDLQLCLEQGERRLQSWLARHPLSEVRLDPRALRNVNRPGEWQPEPMAPILLTHHPTRGGGQ